MGAGRREAGVSGAGGSDAGEASGRLIRTLVRLDRPPSVPTLPPAMLPLGFHLAFRLRDDRVLAPSVAARRSLAHTLARLAEAFPVLAWRVVDTHLHVLGRFSEAQVAELARRLRLALARAHPGVPLLLSLCKPVHDQWHLAEAFTYVLRQDARHGVASDPLQEGSSVLDVLGLRVLAPSLPARVREHLPRLTRAELLIHLGVQALEEAVRLEHLSAATCAAFALESLGGNGAESVAARVAAVHAAAAASPSAVAEALGVSRNTVWKLAAHAPSPRAERAIRLQMSLRAAVPLAAAFAAEPPVARRAVSPNSGRPRGLVEFGDTIRPPV